MSKKNVLTVIVYILFIAIAGFGGNFVRIITGIRALGLFVSFFLGAVAMIATLKVRHEYLEK